MARKVGLLTLPFNGNYGGVLQAASLYTYLSHQGFEVRVIRQEVLRPQSPARRFAGEILSRIPFQNYGHFRRHYLFQKYARELMPNQTRVSHSLADFREMAKSESFDAIIVGSDQVWRWEYIASHYRVYFLGFLEGHSTRRISYAASFGKEEFPSGPYTADIETLLSLFDAVSVREQSGLGLCRLLGREGASWVLDPTFLPEMTFFHSLLSGAKKSDRKFGLSYILDPSRRIEPILRAAAQQSKGVSVANIGLGSRHSVREWLSKFQNSEFVVTDSFHGVVFSILFQKQFIAFPNRARGLERFTSLLDPLGLLNRLLDPEKVSTEAAIRILNAPIDFSFVAREIDKRKYASEAFLRTALA